MAIADKLTELQATKTAIKTAIENKGQDLSGVPFTEYASKIDAIQGGETERSIKKYLEVGGKFAGAVEDFRNILEYNDTENRTDYYGLFSGMTKLKYVPLLNTKKGTNMNYLFNKCAMLVEVPNFDFSSCVHMQYTFGDCKTLTEIPSIDLRNVYSCVGVFNSCTNLTEIWIRNINAQYIVVGSGATWGHLLTRESALHLCKECLTNVNHARTITFATPVYDDLETLYVKLVPITDEMRAEDDLIDEKLPFEVCASTDEGAMTIASYMALKNWSIAK